MKKSWYMLFILIVIFLTLSACQIKRESSDNGYSISESSESISQTTTESFLHQTEVPSGYVGIYSIEDLINSGAKEDGNYILMNDLDLSSISDWTGIRNTGIFDGNNYTISNLSSTKGGLFEYASNISNLNMKNIDVQVIKEIGYRTSIGGIADVANNISNCVASGTVSVIVSGTIRSDYTPSISVGGIVGSRVDRGLITSCVNYTSVKCESRADDELNLRVGGVAGLCLSTTKYCINYGSVHLISTSVLSPSYWRFTAAGGVCGIGANMLCNCNYGGIFSTHTAGGIVGSDVGGDFKIDSCYNVGNVDCADNVQTSAGGIVGFVESGSDEEKGTITNCYNIGECIGAVHCGGIVGNRDYSDITAISYCAYKCGVNITGTPAMYADNKEMSLDDMKDLNNFPFQNKDIVWKDGTGDYPYPVLK